MFLITTADQRFWKTDEPILFLGEWCKLFSERRIWRDISYKVLPYHWDERKKFYQDYRYIDKLYETILAALSNRLNEVHDVDHTLRYWRIIVGPWLSYFIQILYDRHQSILSAEKSGLVTNTLIGKYGSTQWVPKYFDEAVQWSMTNDGYNHYLYSRIIEYINRVPFEVIEIKANTDLCARLPSQKGIFRSLVMSYEKVIPDFLNRITLINSYLSIRDVVKLQISLGQPPYLYAQAISRPDSKIDWHLRQKLLDKTSDDEFESLLEEMIVEQIPSIYLEDYADMKQAALRAYPNKPKVILTATSCWSDDFFKLWAAHHVEQGAKLAAVQYGGNDGACLWSPWEDLRMRIVDKFYTWGWNSNERDNLSYLPAARLTGIARKVTFKKDGRILLILTAGPRYTYLMYCAFVGSTGYVSYLNDQYRFARGLSGESRKWLLVRLYMHDLGWGQKERWAGEFSDIELCAADVSLTDRLKQSRLAVTTYNSTTFLETFTANFPTILFWNPEHWELRPSAQPYFDELRKAGILHYTPESAARKVNEIFDDPVSWWQQPDIQRAKEAFCLRFARTSDNWLKEWKDELKSLV